MASYTCPRCEGLGMESLYQLEKRPEYSSPFELVTWSMNEVNKFCSYCEGTGIVDSYGNSKRY